MDIGHRSFVLVHGAWHGAYVWQSILPKLRALGHIATAPTLSGLGERSYFACDTIDLKWHTEDVVSHILMEDLRNVTLVGWSYAGMVITGVLAQLPDRISKVVYLDAFVPSDGHALIDFATPDALAEYDLHKKYNRALPPPEMAVSGWSDPAAVAFASSPAAAVANLLSASRGSKGSSAYPVRVCCLHRMGIYTIYRSDCGDGSGPCNAGYQNRVQPSLHDNRARRDAPGLD